MPSLCNAVLCKHLKADQRPRRHLFRDLHVS
ncbi:hypothetical protein PanWU01x14_316810 [Parasponia andersonii]|uniref:Uncharacterized protein n=1 Tax=Parasponia andersonii TaxID=3476 RepID=A0A2P5AMW9_PARAD|nr:hypothetical protein PanWU01x14_316810 [Parasponia andersonii]